MVHFSCTLQSCREGVAFISPARTRGIIHGPSDRILHKDNVQSIVNDLFDQILIASQIQHT